MFVFVKSPGMCDVFTIHSRGAVHDCFREESGNVWRFCQVFLWNPSIFVKSPEVCDVFVVHCRGTIQCHICFREGSKNV